jgi:small subunit ribosomal protein S2
MKKEALAVREARRLNIPVIGLVDTNCDPDDADFVIPGNDDAIRSSALIMRVLADGVAEGRNRGVKVSDFVSENGEGGEGEAPAQEGDAQAAEPGGDEAPAQPVAAAETEAAPAEAPTASEETSE